LARSRAIVINTGDPRSGVVEAVLHDIGLHGIERLAAGAAIELADEVAGELRIGGGDAAGRAEQPIVHVTFILGSRGPGEGGLRVVGGPGGHGGFTLPVVAAFFLDEGKRAQRVALGPGLEDQRAFGTPEIRAGGVAEILVDPGELFGRETVEKCQQPLGAVEPAGRFHDRLQILVDRFAAFAAFAGTLALQALGQAQTAFGRPLGGLGRSGGTRRGVTAGGRVAGRADASDHHPGTERQDQSAGTPDQLRVFRSHRRLLTVSEAGCFGWPAFSCVFAKRE
jgi:hypothetical protein